jgi:FlgD Ig-like domain
LQRVLSTVVLLGLLLASAAAFVITEHLKLIKSPVYDTHVTKKFSPVCHCATDTAEIMFKLRHSDSVTVTIVDSGGNVVDTVGTSGEQKGAVTFRWDGLTTTGVAPDGSVYQPQIELARDHRTILMPNKITIDTSPPKVLSASDGDGIAIRRGHHSVGIRYDFSEKAHVAVYLGGRRIILGRRTRPQDKVKWSGKADGKTLPPGRYVLEVGAIDIAGNETPPAERRRLVVRIRSIALGETSIRVVPGARFTVNVWTGAPQYAWKFAGENGTEEKKLLHLRAPARPGRYRLVVSEHGYSTSAIVIVGRK